LTPSVAPGKVLTVKVALAMSLGTLVLIAVLGASPLGEAAQSGSPGRWELVGTGGISSPEDELGHVRDDAGTLHVAWSRRTGPSSYDLVHNTIDGRGRLGTQSLIASGWNGIGNVSLHVAGARLFAFFAGTRTTTSSERLFGLNEAVSSNGGTAWSLDPESIYRDEFAYAADVSAVPGPDPDGLQAWAGRSGIGVHVGDDPRSPFQLGYGPAVCCSHGVNIARDDVTGQTMLAWCTMNDAPGGIWAQAVNPATGAPLGPVMRMPGTADSQGSRICDAGIRVPLVARRGGGGFWIIARSGDDKAVLIWRVGAGVIRVASGLRASNDWFRRVGLTASRDGRLWAAWSTFQNSHRVWVRRSNRGANFFGEPVMVPAPRGAVSAQVLDLSSAGPRLDLLVTYSEVLGKSLQHTQALPGLTLKATGGRIVRFGVTDAGDPVAGATVSVAGRRLVTGANGRVSVDLRPGRFTARASKTGYVGASARLRSR
jgi:hypothetical protein